MLDEKSMVILEDPLEISQALCVTMQLNASLFTTGRAVLQLSKHSMERYSAIVRNPEMAQISSGQAAIAESRTTHQLFIAEALQVARSDNAVLQCHTVACPLQGRFLLPNKKQRISGCSLSSACVGISSTSSRLLLSLSKCKLCCRS